MVNCLRFDLSYTFNPFPGLFALIELLEKPGVLWQHITSLELELTFSPFIRGISNFDHPEFMNSKTKVTSALAVLLPCLRKLKFLGIRNNKAACCIFGQFTSRIINQVSGLKSAHPLQFSTPTFSESLSYLNISFDNEAVYQLPRVYAASLKYLRIYSIPVSYTWDQFVCNKSTNIIDFDSLETLDILYNSWSLVENRHIESQPPSRRISMRFNKLQTLYISNCTGYCAILEDGEFPAKMQLVRFSGIVPAIESLSHMKLKSVEALKVCVRRAMRNYAYNPTATLARIFNSIDVKQVGELLVYDTLAELKPMELECACMTRLSISPSLNCTELLHLVCKLPNLIVLEIDDLTDAKIPMVARLVGSDDDTRIRVQPIKTRLQNLTLRHSADTDTVNNIKQMVLYLILGIPTLQALSIPIATMRELDLSVTNRQELYPHLKNIWYSTYSDPDVEEVI
ncbi:hypothetical protein H4R24_002625 [Coemansia sp. RSA 988]|nr:hypothetical protein H4R24_002625 [Coemansia sp. RSA 988]